MLYHEMTKKSKNSNYPNNLTIGRCYHRHQSRKCSFQKKNVVSSEQMMVPLRELAISMIIPIAMAVIIVYMSFPIIVVLIT